MRFLHGDKRRQPGDVLLAMREAEHRLEAAQMPVLHDGGVGNFLDRLPERRGRDALRNLLQERAGERVARLLISLGRLDVTLVLMDLYEVVQSVADGDDPERALSVCRFALLSERVPPVRNEPTNALGLLEGLSVGEVLSRTDRVCPTPLDSARPIDDVVSPIAIGRDHQPESLRGS